MDEIVMPFGSVFQLFIFDIDISFVDQGGDIDYQRIGLCNIRSPGGYKR
jgi:hypothetical protein